MFHWPLDESSGTVAYDVAGGSNGSLLNGVQWDPQGGHHDGAARFDGVDDRIQFGSCDLTTGTGISISLWVKPDFVTGMERTLIAKTIDHQVNGHIWSLAFVNATAIRFRLMAGSTTTELTSPPSSLFGGSWYHIVATYDGSEMRIVINGSLIASTPKNGLLAFHPQTTASLGATSEGLGPISAWIDDVRIYDRGLTVQEILTILMETVTTGIGDEDEEAIAVLADGRLQLPEGNWESVRILDSNGRMLNEQPINGPLVADLRTQPAGLYLVCLEGRDARRTQRILVP